MIPACPARAPSKRTSSDTNYAGNSAVNRSNDPANTDNFKFSQNFDTTTTYTFSFFVAGTLTPFTNNNQDFSLSLAVTDVDGSHVNGQPLETFAVLTPATYTLSQDTDVVKNGNSFSSNGDADGVYNNRQQAFSNNVDESNGIAPLTTAQENVSVGLTFENKNVIQIEFSVLNTGNTGQTARNLYIDGRGGDTTDIFNTSTQTLTGTVPEPSSYALLLGLAALCLL